MSSVAAPDQALPDRLSERHHAARQRAIITATDLLAKLRAWARGSGEAPSPCLVRRVEHGDVLDLRGFRCNRRLDLGGFYFEVAVDLRDSRIDGPLMAREAVFEFGLHLGGARIRGTFDAAGSMFEDPHPDTGRVISKPAAAGRALLDLNHATVTGDVTLDAASVAGGIDLACCRITGDVTFHGVQAEGDLDLRNATVSGNVSSKADAGAVASPARVAALKLAAAHLRGGVHLDGYSGGPVLGESLQAEYIRLDGAEVPSFNLRSARISGGVAFTACDVTQVIDLRNCEADELVIAGCACNELILTAAQIRRVAWLLPHGHREARVTQKIDAYGLSVGMDLKLSGIDAAASVLDLRNARLGSVAVSPGLIETASGEVAPVGARFGRFDGRGVVVDGNVELVAQVIGPVDLTSATIRGRLSFAARCVEQVSLRLVTCTGDADLSRLTIAPAKANVASLDVSGADIKGSLLLCDPASASTSPGSGLVLRANDGTVLAGGARIGHLRVSGDSFVAEPRLRGVGTSWNLVDAGVATVCALGMFALVAAAVAAYGAIVRDGGPAAFAAASAGTAYAGISPAWKYGGAAALLLALGLACVYEGWRVLAMTLDATAPGLRRLEPWALARHHLLHLHGVDRRELTLAGLQSGLRVLLTAALCGFVAWPYLQPDETASPGALLIPLLAVVALILWAYVRILLATLHAHACSSSRVPLGHEAGSAAHSFFRNLKNFAAIVVAADIWALYGVALALHWSRNDVPDFVMQHPLATLLVFLVLPFAGIWATRTAQLHLRRRLQEQASNEPPTAGQSSVRDAFEGSVRPESLETPPVADRRPRPDIAGLSLHVMAFRDVMQVATGNVIKSSTYRGQRASLDLDRASIGDLEILKPIPRYVGISNLAVQRWRIDGSDEVQNTLEVLDHAAEFEADMYQKVADTLRNGGQRADAEVVHRASRRQARWRETRWGKTFLSLLHGLIGYGTHRGPLLAVMGLWFVFTATWFGAEYERVLGPGPAYALDALQVGKCEVESEHTAVDDCQLLRDLAIKPLQSPDLPNRIARALSVAIRYHIPIIPWDMYPFAQPKETYVWAYTGFVTAVHWVLWPLLLASLIPALLPRGTRD